MPAMRLRPARKKKYILWWFQSVDSEVHDITAFKYFAVTFPKLSANRVIHWLSFSRLPEYRQSGEQRRRVQNEM